MVKTFYKLYTTDVELTDQNTWYIDANKFAQELSTKYNVELDKVCQVIAILSPLTPWEKNKLYAIQCLESYNNGTNLPCHQFTANTQKAYAVLNGQKITWGKKTYAFYQNIVGNPNHVTVDSLMISAALGCPFYTGVLTCTDSAYDMIADSLTYVAKRLNVTPSTLQAKIWCVTRNGRTRDKSISTIVKFLG